MPQYLTFPIGIIGIHAPTNQESELLKLYKYLDENNQFLRFFIIATSGRMMIGKATSINKDDIMQIPFSPCKEDLVLSDAEKIVIEDVEKYFSNNFYRIQSGSDNINIFSNTLCQILNSIYQSGSRAFRLFKVLDAGRYFAVHFEYTDQEYEPAFETKVDLEEYIKQVIPTEKTEGKSFHIQRIIKIYGKDTIILAKPKQLRYWLPSIALRDADEAFADYIKARYY